MEIAIIGGGAAGLCAGVHLVRGGAKVTIYERKDRVGKKLLATGNGRCNVSNRDLDLRHWHHSAAFVEEILAEFSPAVRDEFFASLGIDLVEEDRGKLYPATLQARTVLNSLRRHFASAGGEEKTDCFIRAVHPEQNALRLEGEGEVYATDRVLVATGGRAMPASGSDGKGYQILTNLGHKLTRTFAGISALVCESPYLRHLSGTKVEGTVVLYRDGEEVQRETGEILFAKDGISGPPVLDLARAVGQEKGQFTVSVPMLNHLEQIPKYRERIESRSYLADTAEGFLEGIVSNKWVHVVLKETGIGRDEPMDALDYEDRMRLLDALFAFSMPVTGVRGYDFAQVTCGGIDLADFTPQLESVLCPGVYAAGEVLDVDGDCGGYNIHWAMASARRAALDMLKKMS